MSVAKGKPRGLLATKQDGGILGTHVPKSKGQPKQKRKRPTRLAGKLTEIRARLGLSQGDMVRRLGLEDELERDYISKYERDILEPPLHVLCAYADVANVFLDVLARDYLDLPDKLPSGKRHEGLIDVLNDVKGALERSRDLARTLHKLPPPKKDYDAEPKLPGLEDDGTPATD